ncbi:HPF/RaiA family ribosome-associated protein [Salegentibacter sp. F188]|uniref:HPF/RaiA family ribosome-associated protein n=1 Tax=Autumnicola patrickiae TaxID=3075591 RepID=A0ABU3E533_9FLAO|nr:HPF/RaiA family ribosome-associated protein [Salegentibacter sp. F188]MDT0691100.1 HPF/RaiA family ribosome-associated protein [Salegentibacter sp. F188]
MTVDINCAGVSCKGDLFQYVIANLLKLEKQYSWLKASEVFFKDVDDAEGKRKICEIELKMPGSGVFASAKNTDFQLAAKETIKILNKRLRKHNESFIA